MLSEWSPSNNCLFPSNLTIGSHQKVQWVCSKQHSWTDTVYNRIKGRNCPVCSNKKVVAGINDLKTTHPELVKEWDVISNGELSPTDITYGSEKKVWWRCRICGNKWSSSPNNRTSANRGCPFCAHRKVNELKTSLFVANPQLAAEWDYDKNGSLTPAMVFPNSKKSVWWKCSVCGSEWKASVDKRNHGTGCPQCSARFHTSFPEQAIYFYVKQTYPDAVIHYTDVFNNGMELDIYIPSEKIGIEYDGRAFHTTKAAENREINKYSICKKNDITLIRVKESIVDRYSNNCDILIHAAETNYHKVNLDRMLTLLESHLLLPDHDCNRDKSRIMAAYYTDLRENCLAVKDPLLAKEWNYERNATLTPKMFSANSGQKVWWRCSLGHEWETTIYNRQHLKSGCPYCMNVKVLSGFNDLASKMPDLLDEWNYEKNKSCSPDNILFSSNKKVWWVCKKCGYEWSASVYNRTQKNTGCPVCSNNIVKKGYNDLATTQPELLKEWDYSKNDLSPYEVCPGSAKKAWWICSNGHTWSAEIRSRVRGNGCPYCRKERNKKKSANSETI